MKLREYMALVKDGEEVTCWDKDVDSEFYFYKKDVGGKPNKEFPNYEACIEKLIDTLDVVKIHDSGIEVNLYELLENPKIIQFAKDNFYEDYQYEDDSDVTMLLFDDNVKNISQGYEHFSEMMVQCLDNAFHPTKSVDELNKKTVVVNLFAGPGAGKTTCAWAIASELKKRNIETEYVSEYAKELVWDNRADLLDGSFEHQTTLYEEQNRRVQRLLGKVDVVVTDSPAILSLIYIKEKNPEFESVVLDEFNQQQNFNLFINRGKEFQQAGRVHNLEQSMQIDNEIKGFLRENHIYFGSYYHHTLDVLVDNVVKNLNNVNSLDLDSKIANATNKAKEVNSSGEVCKKSDFEMDK